MPKGSETVNEIALSVIIVSYENYRVLKDCLESIRKFNDIGNSLEVIVVEQSKEDDVFNAVKKDFPEVVAIRNTNEGFGAGNNVGARAAHGTHFLFLNPDTLLIEPVFRYAVDYLSADDEIGMFGLRLIDAEGNRNQSFYFRKTYSSLRGLLWRFCDRVNLFLPKAMYITGADMFVPAKAFIEAGGFDEAIFMYYEEIDLCTRLNSLGYRVVYSPKKRIVHLEGKSSSSVCAKKLKTQLQSSKTLCDKFGWSYTNCLNHLKFNRRLKLAFHYGNCELAKEELSLLEDVCNEEDSHNSKLTK